jgi:predicted nuclease of predicted toxin-antitoxin system
MTGTSPAGQPRLYLNHDVSAAAAEALRARGYDVVAAQEVGMERASDEEHLARAAAKGRVLVSFNVRDYPTLHATFVKEGRPHAGILLSRQVGVKATIRKLEHVLTTKTAEELRNDIRWLPGAGSAARGGGTAR